MMESDFYKCLVSRVLNIPVELVTERQRTKAKFLCFSKVVAVWFRKRSDAEIFAEACNVLKPEHFES